MQEKICSWQ